MYVYYLAFMFNQIAYLHSYTLISHIPSFGLVDNFVFQIGHRLFVTVYSLIVAAHKLSG